ncbi:MAG: PhnD/SsuA/transferrin family substrate-binding protein [Gallionellaceae bacterium]|nr:PhnD/SsuA/transferrin family substrate-binding protein [Gallionellaceae bacterium]
MKSGLLRSISWFWLVTCFWSAGAAWAAAPVTLGILAFRAKADTLARWQPTADYLAAKTGRTFVIEAMNYPELEAAVGQHRIDFILTNPSHYVMLTRRNALSSPLATLIELDNGLPLTQFGGVIFTRAERKDIASLNDLRGKTVAFPDIGSLGGYQMQAAELLHAGLSPSHDINPMMTGMPHDKAVYAVLEGRADAGFVRTGVLESLAQSGRIEPGRIVVLNRQPTPGFPFMLSTRLFPEWPFAAMPQTDERLAQEVAKALFSLRADHPAARVGRYHGWAIPTDYEPVRAMLQELRLPPYDQAPAFTWNDVLDKHWLGIALGGVAGLAIVVLSFMLAVRQRQLRGHESRRSEERRQLLAALGEGIYGVDPEGRCTFVNPTALAMLGYDPEELLGLDQHALIHHHRPDGRAYPHGQCPIYQTLHDGQVRRLDEWFFRKDGTGFPVEMTVAPMNHADMRTGAVVVFHDIRERKRLEAELQALATTDPLTGLPNRRHFLARLEQEKDRLQRHNEPPATLLMLDLDHFKLVNDSHGHAAGDAVLRRFADLLGKRLRKTDLVGRLGGEEFAILLFATHPAGAREFAEGLREQVAAEAIVFGDTRLGVTVSIGMTQLLPDDASADAALARADAALYRAKENGRNRVETFRL